MTSTPIVSDPNPAALASTDAPLMSVPLAIRDTAGVAKRNLLRILRTPILLVISAFQPAMLLLLFRYVLGGAIRIPSGRYVDFVVPAVFVEAVLIGGITTAIGLAQDVKSGIIDRWRSLPMARAAVLAGRTLADLCRSVLALGIMVGLGVAVGFRFHSHAAPRVDTDQRRIAVPTRSGPALLVAAGRALQDADIAFDDLGVRRPTLEDVFLTLTGAAPDSVEPRSPSSSFPETTKAAP